MSKGHIPFGMKYAFVGQLDATGYMAGGYLGAPAAGDQDGDAAIWWEGAQNAPMSVPDVQRIAVPFDDAAGVVFDVESDDTPSATLTWAKEDLDMEAMMQGTKVHTVGDMEIGGWQATGSAQKDLFIIMQQRSKTWYPGSRGLSAWSSIYVPLCSMRSLGRTLASKAFNGLTYAVTTSKSSLYFWGQAFSTANNGFTASPMLPVHHDNLIYPQRFTGDGTETDFNLDYDPVSAAKVMVFVDGAIQTITTHYTVTTGASPLVSFVSAPANNAKIVIVSEVLEANLVAT